MTLSTISAGSVICSTCASSSTLFASGVPSRRRARRVAMQLNLEFFDQPDVPPSAPAAWDQIDEAARMAAIEILARLIARLLPDDLAMEASDE
ncbi:hypothetical protein XH83_35855 (plasmid) [Bradyrhizobium sp. CCBAU 53351]|uniref:Uncharacterized protein n=3 Tax=Bradyrhizobium TaxID=374 RepID=A0ABY0E680_9BRAD|nr:hypothetical protein XH90_37345 [Bradyrhizobium sp. CCBAU 53338]QOZ80894.1 hypothetical protein XH83_35855 [Bradyrhizobium sp. CCBAU 53351]RXH13257.1 hypothetical protein EAS56_14545 [Bradyrhizobium guangzhouense]